MTRARPKASTTRAAGRRVRLAPAPRSVEPESTQQQADSDQAELDALHHVAHGDVVQDAEDAVRIDSQHDLDHLQSERDGVRRPHQHPFLPTTQPPGRKGEERVQEHGRREHVEQVTDAVEQWLAGPLQRNQTHDEAGEQHQRTQPAGRSPPPGERAADRVRDDDPAEQEEAKRRRLQPGTGQAEDEDAGEHGDAGHGDGPEQPGARRLSMTGHWRAPSRRAPAALLLTLTSLTSDGTGRKPPLR